jgi:hypothetical protein
MSIYEKVEPVVEAIGGNVIEVKPNTALSYCLDQAIAGNGDRLDEMANGIADVLTTEVLFIKNTILKDVENISKYIKEEVISRQNSRGELDVNVVPVSIPDFILETQDRNGFFINGEDTLPNDVLVLPNADSINLEEYKTLGAGSIGIAASDFMDTIPEKDLKRIWNDYLSYITFNNEKYLRLDVTKYQTEDTVNDMYVLYIFLSNLVTKIPDKVNAKLAFYNASIQSTLNFIKKKILNKVKRNEIEITNGLVVLGSNSDDKVIFVNKDNYDKYLRKEGSVDVILGAFVNGLTRVTATTLEESKEKLLNAWSSFYTLHLSKIRSDEARVYRIVYENAIISYVNGLDEDILDVINLEKETLFDDIRKTVKAFNVNDIHEVRKSTMTLFSDVVYKNTNLKKFITYVDGYKRMDKNLTTDRALTYALLEIITDYVSGMLEVK